MEPNYILVSTFLGVPTASGNDLIKTISKSASLSCRPTASTEAGNVDSNLLNLADSKSRRRMKASALVLRLYSMVNCRKSSKPFPNWVMLRPSQLWSNTPSPNAAKRIDQIGSPGLILQWSLQDCIQSHCPSRSCWGQTIQTYETTPSCTSLNLSTKQPAHSKYGLSLDIQNLVSRCSMCLNPQTSPEKVMDSKQLLTRCLEDFGCLGYLPTKMSSLEVECLGTWMCDRNLPCRDAMGHVLLSNCEY